MRASLVGRGGVLRRLVLALLPALALLWAGAGPAAAHATLASTVPAAGSVVEAAPATVRLSFTEGVRPVVGAFVLYDSSGEATIDGTAVRLGVSGLDTIVTVTLPQSLPRGSYLLGWRVVSEDSHPVSGVLAFAVGEVSVDPPTAPAAGGSSSPVGVAFVVLTVAAYLGLFVAAGLRVFDLVLRAPADRVARRLVRGALALAVVSSALLAGVGELRQQGGSLAGLTLLPTWTAGFAGPAGAVVGLTVLAAVLLSVPVRGGGATIVVCAGALLAAASVLPTGHTRTVAPIWLMSLLDLVHAAAAAVWLGGVIGLGLHLRRTRRAQGDATSAATVVVRFSGLAGLLVALLGASGLVMTLLVLHGDVPALFTTGWGRALLVKVSVVGVVALLALGNRLFLVPAVHRRDDAGSQWRALRAAVLDEAVLLVVVLAVTGLLTQQSPSELPDAPDGGTPASGPVTGGLGTSARRAPLGSGSLQGRLQPATVGPNTLELTVRDADGAPLQPVELPAVLASLPEARLRSLPATVTPLPGVGHYRADVQLPAAGDWQILVSVRLGRFDEPTTTLVVPVAG